MSTQRSPVPLTKKLEALSKISNAITSDLYLEDILKLIVTVTAQTSNGVDTSFACNFVDSMTGWSTLYIIKCSL